ncbi:MAG: O-antigen ligase family protein, partial [Chloroflexi bacterium]|nr:O-antigen ligase family protein [Chloroflexota bacterium]
MSQQSSRVRQIVGRAAALLALTYVLAIGGTWNGIVTPGFRQFSLAMLTVCVAAWLAVLWRQPHRRALPPGAWVILALWGAAYANSVLHHDSLRAWTGAWFGALYAGVWIVLLDLRGRGVPGRWIINGALVAVAPVMLLAIIQIAPWWPAWIALERVDVAFVPPRPPGTLGNPNALGCVLAGTLPFGLVRIRWGLRRVDRVFAALWCCLAAGVLLLTVSRGAWLAACAGIVVLVPALAHPGAWLHGRAGSTRLWSGLPRAHARLLAVALIAVVIGGAAIAWTSDAFDTPRRETGPRMDFYRIGWRAFREQPWTGTGPFTFGLSQSEAQSIPPEQPHAHA